MKKEGGDGEGDSNVLDEEKPFYVASEKETSPHDEMERESAVAVPVRDNDDTCYS